MYTNKFQGVVSYFPLNGVKVGLETCRKLNLRVIDATSKI